MAFKVFTDANFLLDFTIKRENYIIAKQIVGLAIEGNVQLFITPSVLHIAAYFLTKTYGKKKAKELILSLLDNITLIDADHSIALNALYSKMDDIEDALQYFTAMHHKLDYFITRDSLFSKQGLPGLPIITPEYFLKKVYNN